MSKLRSSPAHPPFPPRAPNHAALGVSLRLHPRRSRDPRAAPPRPAALHHGRFGHPRRAPRLGVRLVLRQASAAATPFTGAPLRCHATLPSRARAATVPQFAGIGYGNAPHRSKSTGGGLASRATHTAAAGAKPTAAIVSPLYAHARLRASPSVPCIPRPTPVPALPSPSYHVLHELMRVVCDAEGARCVARTSYRGAPRFALVGGLATTATLFLQSGAQVSERCTSFPEPIALPRTERQLATCRHTAVVAFQRPIHRSQPREPLERANRTGQTNRRLAGSGAIPGCPPGRISAPRSGGAPWHQVFPGLQQAVPIRLPHTRPSPSPYSRAPT